MTFSLTVLTSLLLVATAAAAPTAPDAHTLTLEEGQTVNVAGKALQLTNSPLSIQAWVKTTRPLGHIFETAAENRSESSPQSGYALYIDKGGMPRFGVNNSPTRFTYDNWDNASCKIKINDGKWHHLTGVFNGDGKTRIQIYVDGKQATEDQLSRVGQAQPSLASYTSTTPTSRIGAATSGVPTKYDAFIGQIDELRIWNIALTAQQIAANYNQVAANDAPGLIARWSFDSGDNPLKDVAGDHHGSYLKAAVMPQPKHEWNYALYPGGLTGYTGYDRNVIAHWTLKPAARRRVAVRNEAASFATMFKDAPTTAMPSETHHVRVTNVTGGKLMDGIAPPRPLPLPADDRTAEHVTLSDSQDGGKTWSTPRVLLGYSQSKASLLKLADGRLLCTYHNMHVPFAIMGMLSSDDGKTWDTQHPIFLARAWGPDGGWSSSIQKEDGTVETTYVIQAYRAEGKDCVAQAVQWQLPPVNGDVNKIAGVPSDTPLVMEPHNRDKYPAGLYGYAGINQQRVAYITHAQATRTTIGHRGLYKGALAKLHDGTLIATPSFRSKVQVYRSKDNGDSWQFVDFPGFGGKEMGAAVLRDGTLLNLHGGAVYRSTDSGKTWDYAQASNGTSKGFYLVRNVVEKPDGSLIMVAGLGTYYDQTAPMSKAWRMISRDGGSTWPEAVEIPSWQQREGMFDEAAMIRLPNGNLLAASRVTDGHHHGGRLPACGYPAPNGSEDADHMMLIESADDGLTWSKPRDFLDYARPHAELLLLKDGRILSCYANYSLPLGVFAVISEDGGKTWSHDTPIQIGLSTRVYTGWPTSVQLDDDTILTMYAASPYLGSDFTTAQTVRWKLPPRTLHPAKSTF